MNNRRKFIKRSISAVAGGLFLGCSGTQTIMEKPGTINEAKEIVSNPYGISKSDVDWIKESTIKQLKGSKVEGKGGILINTPDGVGNYKALWTRDYYYHVEYAGDLLEQSEIKAAIQFLVDGQREDGCMPDRVNAAGVAIYSPGELGKPLADHAVDNGPFMAMLLCSYANQFNDKDFFLKLAPSIRKGLDFVHVKENGLVYNKPEAPQCVYGFTDIVKKTGYLLFSSLLYYKANLEMYNACQKFGLEDSSIYRRRYEYVRQSIYKLWDEERGMFWAADQKCKQIDIWGSAYAVEVGITSDEQTQRIASFLVDNYDSYTQRGQMRHLYDGDATWEELFIEVAPGEYQNGAYWATPLAWMVPVINKVNPKLAKKTLTTVIKDFQKYGINECVNGSYVKVPNFVASATNVYALTK